MNVLEGAKPCYWGGSVNDQKYVITYTDNVSYDDNFVVLHLIMYYLLTNQCKGLYYEGGLNIEEKVKHFINTGHVSYHDHAAQCIG